MNANSLFRLAVSALLAAGTFPAATHIASAEPLRLLEHPEAWIIPNAGYDSFVFEEGGLVSFRRGSGLPGTMLTREDYENFELSFEISMSRGNLGGLYFSMPRNGAYRAGIQLRLAGRQPAVLDEYSGGAIYREVAPEVWAMKDQHEWNQVHVRMFWPRLSVRINELLVHDIDLSEHEALKYKPRRGAIGFASTSGYYQVRNFELTPLSDTENGIELFDGETLDGWEIIHNDAVWTVHEGAIRAENGNGYLMYDRPVQDFDLRLYYRTSPAANGGIFFRWVNGETIAETSRGQEIQIWDVPEGHMVSGSVYNLDPADDWAFRPGEWNFMQISVRGSSAVVHMNGLHVSESDQVPVVRPGNIVLQMHRADCWVDFKDLVLVPRD